MAGVDSIDLHPPVWNRNYGVDDDEEEDVNCPEFASPIVALNPGLDGVLPCDVLVVTIGPHASVFATAALEHLPDDKLEMCGCVLLPEASFECTNLVSDPTCLASPGCSLFRTATTDQKVVVLAKQPRLLPNGTHGRCFDWVEALLGAVRPKRVLLLSTLFHSDFSSRQPPPLLRLVRTTAAQDQAAEDTVCPLLEVPNVLSGAPAELLSHCEAAGIPAELFLSIETPEDPVGVVAAFAPVLPRFGALSSPPPAKGKELHSVYTRLLGQCKIRRTVDNLQHILPDTIYL